MTHHCIAPLMREAGDLEDEQGVTITSQSPDITLSYRTGVSPKKTQLGLQPLKH